jgi:hypothetical protein
LKAAEERIRREKRNRAWSVYSMSPPSSAFY